MQIPIKPAAFAATLATLGLAAQCHAQGAAEPRFPGGDGGSCEQAVVLNVDSSLEAVRAETAWLHAKHGGGRKRAQALTRAASKWYDIVDWEVPNGTAVTICFDVTRAYEELGRAVPGPASSDPKPRR
jgi:hypothetical protein